MSQENVKTVQRWIEALNRRDVATMSALWRSDGEVDWSRARGPLKRVYRGRSEYESLWNEFFTMFEKSEVETHGFREAGSEVVMPHTTHFRGREGIEATASATWVYTVEDGQITRLRLFQEEAEALEAVGLTE